MKNKTLSLLGIFVAFLFLFSACEKTEIEKANEDYNYDKTIPDIIGGINGETSVVKTNTKKYSLGYFRGGSTWAWTATGAELQAIEGSNGNEVNVFFNLSNDEFGDSITVTVVETTQGGVVSDPATIRVYVSPFVISISGPANGVASGAWIMNYSVPHDDGATYEWTVFDHTATVTPDASGGAAITWDLSATDITGGVRCVKTYKGLQSVPATFSTDLIGFCPMTVDDFVGTWTGVETGDSKVDPLTVTIIKGSGVDEVIVKAVAGIPGFHSAIFTGWGEVFQSGFGNEGDIILQINELTGAITIPLIYWGQTLPGPYDYEQNGSGIWSGCGAAPSMSIDMLMDASGWRSSHLELTKQ